MLGRRIARDGSRTWYLRPGRTVSAALVLPGGELVAGAVRETVLAYELDARGRPRALRVMRVGELRGGASAALRRGVGRGKLAAAGGAVVELEGTLDLREPAARAAAAALLAALAGGGGRHRRWRAVRGPSAGSSRGTAGSTAASTCATRVTTGLGVGAALGTKLDAGLERTADGLRLLAAETRLPGLPFLPRDDCRRPHL